MTTPTPGLAPLPCPFCERPTAINVKRTSERRQWVECYCGARGPVETHETKAIAAWNRRAALTSPLDPDTAGLVDQLRGLLTPESPMHPIGCASWEQDALYLIERAADAISALQADPSPSQVEAGKEELGGHTQGETTAGGKPSGWRPISTAPRDGTTFRARCPTQTRTVRFAYPDDRMPVGDDGDMWETVPTHWQPLSVHTSNHPTTDALVERERVARIIDPAAFSADYITLTSTVADHLRMNNRAAAALAKADAILEALSAQPGTGGRDTLRITTNPGKAGE